MKTFIVFLVILITNQPHSGAAYPGTNSTGTGNEKNELFSSQQNSSNSSDAKPEQQATTAEYNVETKSLSQNLLESPADLRDFIANKVADIYDILKELDKTSDSQTVLRTNVDQVPHFSDPFYIGKFNKTYKLADMQYTNVKVHGMSNFQNYVISIDSANRKANITLVADRLKIDGNYTLSNFLKHASGAFSVKLMDNVTYSERDIYCKFNNDVDIAAAEATMTYGKSESDYENIGLLAHLFEGVISNKLTEEILYRIGREVGHKIRHVTTSKIAKATSEAVQPAEYNRIAAIIKTTFSQIRTILGKATTINIPLPGIHHEIKVQKSFVPVENVTLRGLGTLRLTKEVKTELEKDNFSINLEGEAGPFVIFGQLFLTEEQQSKPVSVTKAIEYEVSAAQAKLTISTSIHNAEDSFEVTDLEVNISQPSMKMKSDKDQISDNELQQLALLLKPAIEMELYKWLKDFVNDIFRRNKLPAAMQIEPSENSEQFYS